MGKVIATVGVVVGAVALAATGIGAIAAPALAGSVSLFGVSASTMLLAGTALQAVGQALIKRPEASTSTMDRLNASLVTDTPRKIAFGRTALNTDLRYQEWWGANQEYCSQVFVVASHWCESIDEIWLDDKLAWSSAGGVAAPFAGYLVVQPRPQATAGLAFAAGWSGRWGVNASFAGCATLYLQFKVTGNGKKATSPFASSITSRVTVVGKGARLPDPRFDSTAGGSGAVRVGDQSTWAWAPQGYEVGRNPALALLFYLVGWRIQNPQTGTWTLAVGRGIPIDRIDLDSFITAANLCDEPVTRADGSIEPRYRCDGTFSEGDDPPQVIAGFEACMNAKLRDSTGRFSLQILHNDLATPVVDFTDDDVLGDFTWTAGNNLNDRKNLVRGRYVDPSALYQLVDFPAVRLASLDGIDRIDSVDLGLVQSPSQAQRLAKQRLQRMQYPGAFGAEFNARGWAVKDGDIVRLTFSALGFDRKLFRVAEGLIDPTGVVPLVLVEEHADIYAWDQSETAAVQAAEPNRFDPLLLPLVQAIDDAGKTAEWPAIVGEGKPEDFATNSADPQSPFGGKKVIDALQIMEKVPAIVADVSDLRDARGRLDAAVAGLRKDSDEAGAAIGALDDAVADGAAARRQMEQDAGRLSAASLQLLLIADGLTQRLRDAGIAIDPNTGVVRIYAVDALAERQRSAEITLDAQAALIQSKASSSEVDEKILKAVLNPEQVAQLEPLVARLAAIEVAQDGIRAELRTKAELVELSRAVARLTTAEQAISATDALVRTKVAQTAFEQALFRIASAEQTLQAYGDVSRLSLELRQARADNRESGAGLLAAVLAGNDAAVRQISAQADLRQELYTSITGVGDALTLEVRARTLLAATVGDLDARSVQDRQLLIRADAVLAQDIDGLRSASDSQAGEIATLRKTSVDAAGGITLLGTTLRQQVRRASEADGATLAGVLAGDEAARRIATGLAEVQTQLTATLVAGFSAAAAERLALRAQIDAADARYTREVQATADRFKSVTQAITALETEYGRQSADLVATRAEIAELARTTSAADTATAELIAGLRAIVNDPATGLGKTRAELAALTDAVATQNTAAVRRLETLEASVNDPTTGLAKTRAALADLAKAFSDELSANAESLREVRASIGTATREVAAQAEQARSAGETRLRTDIADNYEHTMDAIDSANALRDAGDAANRSAIGQVDSRVTDVARAQASDKAALAESIKQVSTTVGGHTTTIDFLLRSLDGKEAVAQLTINANGKITGFVINGQESVFAVAADKFIVGNSQIFEIDTATGQTVVNAIKAGIITAREIAAGAVQQTVFAVTDADIVIQYG